MKETKKFFDDNRLNRGYRKNPGARYNNDNSLYAKYRHVLPPIEVVEQYEEAYPGTFEKLLTMAQKEQDHRHAMESLALEKRHKAANRGRFAAFAILAMAAIICASLLYINFGFLPALIFLVFGVFSVYYLNLIQSKEVSYKYQRELKKTNPVRGKSTQKFNNHHRNKKSFRRASR